MKDEHLCECGCGQVTKRYGTRWRRYIAGHQRRASNFHTRKEETPPLCACGECGRPVKWSKNKRAWNTYLTGHNGRKHSMIRPPAPFCKCGCGEKITTWNASKQKWYAYVKGHKPQGGTYPPVGELPPSCCCGCQQPTTWYRRDHRWAKYLPGHRSGTKEHKDATSKRMKKKWQDEQYRDMMMENMTNLWQDDEFKSSMSERAREQMLAQWQNEQYRQSRIAESTERHNRPEWRVRASENMKRAWKARPGWHEEQSRIHKKLWEDPEYRERNTRIQKERWTPELRVIWAERTKRQLIDQGIRNVSPNKLESLFDNLTNDNIRFVGDGSFWRTWPNGKHKNPDYLVYDPNSKPTRLIIELWGNFWHANDDPMLDITMWGRLGYQCLVLWESDIHDNQEEVLDLVSDFIDYEARVA